MNTRELAAVRRGSDHAHVKPVAIFRHSATEGPGYLATYLDARRIPWQLLKIEAGDPVPVDTEAWAGFVFMGGPMSVNDDLPWVGEELALVRRAVAAGVPTLGHCLGGQLMAKALGGAVSRNPVKEIGWGQVTVSRGAEARRWFGKVREFLAFHWHGETFTVPDGATCILESPWCASQAFALGPHLGLQCHVEMTPALIRAWCEDWGSEVRGMAGPSIQTPEQMEQNIDARVRALNAVADRLYDRWVEGLKR
jgi:GMP synthase-like glutamine amidotransferase